MATTKWEYQIVSFENGDVVITSATKESTLPTKERKVLIGTFDQLGEEGWEAVSTIGIPKGAIEVLFKRSVTDDSSQD